MNDILIEKEFSMNEDEIIKASMNEKIKLVGDRLGRHMETYGEESLFIMGIFQKESISESAWHAIHYGQFMFYVNRQLGREIMKDLGMFPRRIRNDF